jgi:hypothetical protein
MDCVKIFTKVQEFANNLTSVKIKVQKIGLLKSEHSVKI